MIKQILAVDFDGVIHSYGNIWQDGAIYGEPVDGAMESLFKLSERFDITVLTSRDNHGDVSRWMKEQQSKSGFYFDFHVTNVKPIAVAYIDDRAIRFTNWNDIRKYWD